MRKYLIYENNSLTCFNAWRAEYIAEVDKLKFVKYP